LCHFKVCIYFIIFLQISSYREYFKTSFVWESKNCNCPAQIRHYSATMSPCGFVCSSCGSQIGNERFYRKAHFLDKTNNSLFQVPRQWCPRTSFRTTLDALWKRQQRVLVTSSIQESTKHTDEQSNTTEDTVNKLRLSFGEQARTVVQVCKTVGFFIVCF